MTPEANTVTPQQSLEQERAKFAWECVNKIKENQKEYAGLAKSAPADIQTNGLGQTLAFWRAKGYEKGSPSGNAYCKIYEHISSWLGNEKHFAIERKVTDEKYHDKDGKEKSKKVEKWVLNWIMETANTDKYRRATAEAIALLIWIKKFAEAELAEKAE